MTTTVKSDRAALIAFCILLAMILFTSHVWPQQPTERPVWDVQLAANAHASSNITIQNQCKNTHTFTIIEQQTPYIQLQQGATVTVSGKSSYILPVRFDTTGMQPGPYQGSVVVKCETCSKEKTCTQDREVLPVRLIVLKENVTPPGGLGPSTTPQAGAIGGPVIAGGPGKAGGALLSVKKGGLDFEDFNQPKTVAEREFADNDCKNQTKCGDPIAITAGKDKGRIYCKEVSECGGKDCPKAGCHMFYAWRDVKKAKKDGKLGKDVDEAAAAKWNLFGAEGDTGNTGVGVGKPIKPQADYVYACGCR